MTTTALTLSASELDVLRFILGVVVSDDFESADDADAYHSLCEKVGA